MGSKEENFTLIDLLYRDVSRINSFYAQINKGYLREITKGRAESSATTHELLGNACLVQGGKSSENSNARSLEEHIDPHDQRIIDLLETLGIPPITSITDISAESGTLVLLKGLLSIRDYKTITEALPLILNAFSTGQSKKETRESKKTLEQVLKLLPFGLELELILQDHSTILGMLNPDFMVQKPSDLLMLYGNHLPGKWFVLGILDQRRSSRSYSSISNNDLRSGIDVYADGIQELYNADAGTSAIIPILIYREISS